MPLDSHGCVLYRPGTAPGVAYMLVRITSWKGRNLQNKFYKITTTFYLSYPTRYDYNRTVYMYILTSPLNHNRLYKLRLSLNFWNARVGKALVNPSAS
jgi:hypothetical protein